MFKKELPIIFIGLSVVVAALVLSWAVFIKPEAVVSVQAPIINDNNEVVSDDDVLPDVENDVSDDDISDWKTYRNEEFGFEVKYPEDWEYEIQEGGLGTSSGINFSSPKGQDNFVFFDLGHSSYSEKDANELAQKDFEVREFKVESKEDVFINEIEGVRYISNYNNPINKKYVAAYWSNKFTERENDFYVLETYIKLENKNGEKAIINIFDQMLSTIKFTNL